MKRFVPLAIVKFHMCGQLPDATTDNAGSVMVSSALERIFAFQVEERSDFVKYFSDLFFIHEVKFGKVIIISLIAPRFIVAA